MKAMRTMLRGVGPSAVLQLLADGERSGYELAAALAHGGPDVLPIGEGAAYALLYQIQARRLIASRLDKDGAIVEMRYRLTDKGRRHLERQVRRNANLARVTGAAS